MLRPKAILGILAFDLVVAAALIASGPAETASDRTARLNGEGRFDRVATYVKSIVARDPDAFVMDVTVPDRIADFLADHPNPHVRVVARMAAAQAAAAE